VHRLAGAAGTFGYAAVSDAAGQAEDALLERSDTMTVPLRRLIDLLDACILRDA
jgi:HPt (histidine-containing phosphotransfer) domain-containing protein